MKFLYLIQGQANLVTNYFHLKERIRAEALYLTYDKEIPGADYHPNTTWAEGRNILLEKAKSRDTYDYYIFLDDDIELKRGSWDLFEEKLIQYLPAIGVPIVPKTRYTPIMQDGKQWDCQAFRIHDEQFMAIHRDVINDNLIFPYVTQFDNLSWWAACEIQQILIHTLYQRYTIQFNGIEIANLVHGRHDTKDKSYKEKIRLWIEHQLIVPYTDIWYYWDDWAGADKGFNYDELFDDRIQHKVLFEKKFKEIIMTTILYRDKLQQVDRVSYKLNNYFLKRVLNVKGKLYERISR